MPGLQSHGHIVAGTAVNGGPAPAPGGAVDDREHRRQQRGQHGETRAAKQDPECGGGNDATAEAEELPHTHCRASFHGMATYIIPFTPNARSPNSVIGNNILTRSVGPSLYLAHHTKVDMKLKLPLFNACLVLPAGLPAARNPPQGFGTPACASQFLGMRALRTPRFHPGWGRSLGQL